MQNKRGHRTEPWGTLMFVSRKSEVDILDETHNSLPPKYDQNHCDDDLEKPITCNFLNSFDGDTLSKAFEKSNCNKRVANLLSIPIRMSSVSLIKADCVLWCYGNQFETYLGFLTWSNSQLPGHGSTSQGLLTRSRVKQWDGNQKEKMESHLF